MLKVKKSGLVALLATSGVLVCGMVSAKDLLVGEVAMGDETTSFLLTGESRKDVIGGQIELGARAYTVAKVSIHGLIGGARYGRTDNNRDFGEFVVLSSSFSEQTAVGQPWVSASSYSDCDKDYNSFVALYRVYGKKQVEALGSSPYKSLTDDAKVADESEVYCFYSAKAPDATP